MRWRKVEISGPSMGDVSDWPRWLDHSINNYGCAMEYIRQTLNYMQSFYGWLYAQCRPPAIVLEAGCGSGLTAVIMGGMGYEVTAIDNQEHNVAVARKFAEFLCPRVKVVKQDIFDLKSTEEYDLVLSLGVIEHFPEENALRMLRKLAEVSRHFVLVEVPTSYTGGENCAPIQRLYDEQSLSKLMNEARLTVVSSHVWGQSVAILGRKSSAARTLNETDTDLIPHGTIANGDTTA